MHNDESRGVDAAIPPTPTNEPKAAQRATARRTRAPSAPYRHGKGYAIRRSHNGHDIFLSGFKTAKAAERAMNRRVADTVGTLLASYWAFVSDTPATEADAEILVSMLGIEERIAVHQVSDELQCLEALTSRVVPFKVIDGPALVTRHLSIGQTIETVCKDPTGQPEVVMRLAQMGLRVALSKGRWSLYVANSHTHQELRKLFSGTKWSTGGWSVVLRRLPGGEESTQRIGAGLGPAKVTVVDVPQHLLPAGDEDDMPLAA